MAKYPYRKIFDTMPDVDRDENKIPRRIRISWGNLELHFGIVEDRVKLVNKIKFGATVLDPAALEVPAFVMNAARSWAAAILKQKRKKGSSQ